MRNTQRNLTNIPVNLEGLVHLEDIDMSQNELTKIPEGLLTIPNLKRLNLGSNQVSKPESLFSWSLTMGQIKLFCLYLASFFLVIIFLCKA
jgi:hypothetical protein